MCDGKNYTKEQQIEYELSKIGPDKADKDAFFGRAIDIQNQAYEHDYADAKMEVACEVLLRSKYCDATDCDKCKLETANRRAHSEITRRLREKANRAPKIIIVSKRNETSIKFTPYEYSILYMALKQFKNKSGNDITSDIEGIFKKLDEAMGK